MHDTTHPVFGLHARFGLAVRRQRERHGWSQEQLAGRADVNRSYLGEVERAAVMPSLATAAKLADALQLPLSVLIADCEQPPPGALGGDSRLNAPG